MLQITVDWILYGLMKLDSSSKLVQSLNFFLYDSIKIILLLFLMISIIGFLRTYLSQKKVKKLLAGKKQGFGNLFASLFGAITPFCSCSSIPIFIGFIEARIPMGIAFSFLITSPLVNEYLVVLMLGFFGWKITVAYVLSGILLGVIFGIILGKMNLEKYLAKDIFKNKAKNQENKFKTIFERINFGLSESKDIVKKLWLWIISAVAMGALIHNFVPDQLIQSVINKTGAFAVPMAALLGVPIYASCAAILPIAFVLFQKGVPLGTALAFMMGTAALSLPEAIILRRAMKLKLILIFFAIVAFGIILTGYIFNALQSILI
jgi:uncharacterized protein